MGFNTVRKGLTLTLGRGEWSAVCPNYFTPPPKKKILPPTE